MAQFEFNVVATTYLQWQYGSRVVEKGRLRSICVTPVVGVISWATTFVVIGTTLAAVADDRPSAIFFSGYVSPVSQFIWSGDYPFSPFETFFAKARSLILCTLRVVGNTELGDQ